MKQKKQYKIIQMIAIILSYLGLMLLFMNTFMGYRVERYYVYLILSAILVLTGVILYVFSLIIVRIDAITKNSAALNEMGIEQILPYEYAVFEQLFYENERIRIAINSNRLEYIWIALRTLINKKNSLFEILVFGPVNTIKSSVIEDLLDNKKYAEVKIIEDRQIENIILLEQKMCVMNFSDLDKSLAYLCVFYKSCEYSQKNRKLFEELWNDGKKL